MGRAGHATSARARPLYRQEITLTVARARRGVFGRRLRFQRRARKFSFFSLRWEEGRGGGFQKSQDNAEKKNGNPKTTRKKRRGQTIQVQEVKLSKKQTTKKCLSETFVRPTQ